MGIERVGTVLGQDSDVIDFAVDAVAQGEVNKAELTAKGYGWLGPYFG